MARWSARAGAWLLLAWAAATVVLRPITRLVAESHGFAVKWVLAVDVAFVAYGLITTVVVALHLRWKKPTQVLAWLAVPPLAYEGLRGGEVLRAFVLDLSGYPTDLAVLHWLGNLAFLLLVASLALLVLARSKRDPAGLDAA